MIPAVILAGGLGTRIREASESKPKPMLEIGQKPIIWHIMKNLATSGITEFIICAGYKSQNIKDYFLNYETTNNNFTVHTSIKKSLVIHNSNQQEDWKVTVVDTGINTNTGGRVKAIEKFLDSEQFLVTYGDGLANVDIENLIRFHNEHNGIASVTATRPLSRFGVLDLAAGGLVQRFREKPQVADWVNIGFFIFEQEIFKYLQSNSILEEEPLRELAATSNLYAFQHEGFWQPMDTFRESKLLNELWDTEKAPWKNW